MTMMDKTSVKAQLDQVKDRLSVLDAERDVLNTIRAGLEAWLTLGDKGRVNGAKQPTLRLGDPKAPTGKPVGSVSLRGQVLPILQAAGHPMTTAEIYASAQGRGAASGAKDPAGVVDLILYTMKKRNGAPVQRVGPQTWRWAGEGK